VVIATPLCLGKGSGVRRCSQPKALGSVFADRPKALGSSVAARLKTLGS